MNIEKFWNIFSLTKRNSKNILTMENPVELLFQIACKYYIDRLFFNVAIHMEQIELTKKFLNAQFWQRFKYCNL